ncbi:MAG: alpha/beta fold hydrolase [Bacteroidales bacterium]|nr:alpha/beta fold hydrolase [Candidatus Latescibacterota bacterium]
MKKTTGKNVSVFLLGVLLVFSLFSGVSVEGRTGESLQYDLSGAWGGYLELQGARLRIIFNLTKTGAGTYTATLDSPDQGAKGIPVSSVLIDGDSIHIEVAVANGRFSAFHDHSNSVLDGTWFQSGMILPLVLSKDIDMPSDKKPQDPVSPYPYREEEIVFRNEDAGIDLAGTLTIPENSGVFPAVVLISGSGPQDRNEEVLGHRPFLVISDHLTRKGIAVLRYDDRGVGGSSGDFSAATSVDFAGDARSAIEYLRSRGEIDRSAIGLVGHSEGGLIAPMIASQKTNVSYIILLGGPGLNGGDILLLQSELIFMASGFEQDLVDRLMEQKRLEHSIILGENNSALAKEKMIEASSAFLSSYTQDELVKIGYKPGIIEQRADIYLTSWFRFFMSYDPAPAISRLSCSVLALWGEKDLQVPPVENISAIRKALEAGGNSDYQLKVFPGLNHLFQHCDSGSPSEYASIAETFSPEVLDFISSWILEKTGDTKH